MFNSGGKRQGILCLGYLKGGHHVTLGHNCLNVTFFQKQHRTSHLDRLIKIEVSASVDKMHLHIYDENNDHSDKVDDELDVSLDDWWRCV